jgi:hypothetical protein
MAGGLSSRLSLLARGLSASLPPPHPPVLRARKVPLTITTLSHNREETKTTTPTRPSTSPTPSKQEGREESKRDHIKEKRREREKRRWG